MRAVRAAVWWPRASCPLHGLLGGLPGSPVRAAGGTRGNACPACPTAQPWSSRGAGAVSHRGAWTPASVPGRCTSRTPWGSGSGWTVRTARRSWTTSRRPSAPGRPPRACCCRGRRGAAEGTSVLVREAGLPGRAGNRGFSGRGGLAPPPSREPGVRGAGAYRVGRRVCPRGPPIGREQPAPLTHRGGRLPGGAPDRRGEAEPRAGGAGHGQVGLQPAPASPAPWVGGGRGWAREESLPPSSRRLPPLA